MEQIGIIKRKSDFFLLFHLLKSPTVLLRRRTDRR